MVGCELLDFRCILMNEIVGSALLAAILGAMVYFMIASKLRLGFDTTVAFMVPFLLIGGLMWAGFSTLYYLMAIAVGVLLAWIFNEIIRNR